MKYKSELIKEIVETRGHEKSSIHYESECVESWIEETKGAYPKLCDYQSEWLNYINENPIGVFPYEIITDVTEATVNNVVPYAYKRATLKGQTLVNGRGNTVSSGGWSTTDSIEYIATGNNTFLNFECTLLPNTKYLIFFEFDGRGVGVQYGTRPANGGWDSSQTAKTDGISKTVVTTGSNSKWLSFIVPNTFTVTDYVKISRIMIIPYQDGMENWDIPYFEGMQSVKMPVLTTSNEDGTKTNILTVNEPIELRGIGDVQDTLDCLTGEITHYIKDGLLDGTETWTAIFNSESSVFSTKSFNIVVGSEIIHDKLPDGVNSITNNNGVLKVLTTSAFASVSVNNFIKKLKENPIPFMYCSNDVVIKKVDLLVQDQDGNTLRKIKPIEGTMNIHSDGTPLNPTITMEIPVEATTQNLSSFIKEE